MQLNTVTSVIVKNQPVTLEGNHMFDQDTKSGIFPRDFIIRVTHFKVS